MIIGLVGPIAGGKSQAAEALRGSKFFPFSLSTIVRQYSGRLHGARYADLLNPVNYNSIDRDELQHASKLLRANHGDDILARLVTKVIQHQQENGVLPPNANIVIEGIRGESELKYLIQNLGLLPIGVTATQEARWERVQKRARETHRAGEPQTKDEFLRQDNYEFSEQGNNITGALELCKTYGILIDNTGESPEFTREMILDIAGNKKNAEGQVLTQKER